MAASWLTAPWLSISTGGTPEAAMDSAPNRNDTAPEVLPGLVGLGDGIGQEPAGAILHHCQRLASRLQRLCDCLFRRLVVIAPDVLAQPFMYRLLHRLNHPAGRWPR